MCETNARVAALLHRMHSHKGDRFVHFFEFGYKMSTARVEGITTTPWRKRRAHGLRGGRSLGGGRLRRGYGREGRIAGNGASDLRRTGGGMLKAAGNSLAAVFSKSMAAAGGEGANGASGGPGRGPNASQLHAREADRTHDIPARLCRHYWKKRERERRTPQARAHRWRASRRTCTCSRTRTLRYALAIMPLNSFCIACGFRLRSHLRSFVWFQIYKLTFYYTNRKRWSHSPRLILFN